MLPAPLASRRHRYIGEMASVVSHREICLQGDPHARPGLRCGRAGRAALTILLVAGSVGCRTDAGSGASGPAVAFEKTDPFGVLDAFGGAEAVYRLNAVVRERIRDCMKEKGFTYHPPPADVVARERATQERNLAFGLPPDAPRAGSFGIAASEATYRTELAGLNQDLLASQTEAYRQGWQNALDGMNGPRQAVGGQGQIVVGIEGCEPRALVRTFGDLETAYRIRFFTGAIRAKATASVSARKEVTGPIGRWSSCANSRGFRLDDPGAGYRFVEAEAQRADLGDMSQVSSQESAIYQVLHECEQASQLHVTAWPLVPEEVDRALARRNEDAARFRAAVADAGRPQP